jgi:hypothetical protein
MATEKSTQQTSGNPPDVVLHAAVPSTNLPMTPPKYRTSRLEKPEVMQSHPRDWSGHKAKPGYSFHFLRHIAAAVLFAVLLLGAVSKCAADGARIKDIAMISGVRDNQLMGYGLVVGLAGDGDKNPVQTLQTIGNVLQRFGITVPAQTLSSKNVAIVMVTADIPAFKK